MITDVNELSERIYALTQELEKESSPKRRAQLQLERSVFVGMLMNKKNVN